MQLILATRNLHKVEEIRSILADRFDYRSLQGLPGAPDLVEDADTFEGNATSKAVALACWLGSQERFAADHALVLADDSGLEVDALGGAPGVHSARFAALDDPAAPAGKNAPDAQNNAKLLRLLEKVPLEQRTARFHCVLALVPIEFPIHESADDLARKARTFHGKCEGHIAMTPSGGGGFGYDPLFIPNGYDVSFAELSADVKNILSHRARALEQLKDYFSAQP
jgi:XTP/dITP diphosphohydrolase